MARRKPDTRALGLDVGLEFVRWLTGAENLHYGDWTGLDITAANLRAAQEAYTDRLLTLLPKAPSRILDIGGGAGETAKRLISLGHEVDIVVPSPVLARRCAVNAPQARTHQTMFEGFRTDARFDVCLFSESFQYIPLDRGLPRCLDLLAPGGRIVVSDVFRTPAYKVEKLRTKVGGGHREEDFRSLLDALPLEVASETDITDETAPSVEIEQGLFNVIGSALGRVDHELSETRPKTRWTIHFLLRRFLSERRRARLDQRLNEKTRNREQFARYNRYLMMRLDPVSAADAPAG